MATDKLLTIDIEKLVYGGDGLSRADGQVILTPFVLPGERVEVETARLKNGVERGRHPKVLESSARRVAPRCQYFGNCGGCHYQHAEYGFQLEQKQAILRETLQRLGGVAYDGEIRAISGEPWHYRNRVQLHFDERRMGFHKADSHDLCPIDHCPISSPVLNEAIKKLQGAAKRAEFPKFLRSLELFTNERDLQMTVLDSTKPVAVRFFEWCATFLPNFAEGAIEYEAAGHSFRISRGSFFQVNRFLTDALVEEVAANEKGARAVDLFAGAGLFSIALGKTFERVDAIERGGPAFRDLEFNVERAQSRVTPWKGSADDFLREMKDTPDLIVADPPRAGVGKDAANELIRIGAPRVILVSCDPATLARDLRVLTAAYGIERITLVDLFPQTFHFETVVHLSWTAK